MIQSYQLSQTTQIKNILAVAKSASPTERAFIEQFFDKVPTDDLMQMEPAHAVALALSAYEFASKRKNSAPKIRIFHPDKKEHGYDSKHGVIELLNDDMPFLVDSLSSELVRQGLKIRETIHPIFTVERDKNGELVSVGNKGANESLIHFEVSGLGDIAAQAKLQEDLEWVLAHIRASVEDWHAIEQKTYERIKKLSKAKAHFDEASVREVADFLEWLATRNFVFLGYAEYNFFDDKGRESLSLVPGTALGVLRVASDVPKGIETLPPELRHFLLIPQLIQITKSNKPSLVHRPVLMDYIGIKRFDDKGNVIGEARILGLFTSNVYYQGTESIPFLRTKVAQVLTRSGFNPASHDGKALKTILEFLPRDEIFQMEVDDLFVMALGILALEAKPGVRVFVRRDAFERFVNLMVFVPREQFSTDLRRQIQSMTERAFAGSTSSFSTQITEAPLARLHLTIHTTPGHIPPVDSAQLQEEIAKCAYMWSDLLHSALYAKFDDTQADYLHRRYAQAFPQHYINDHSANEAVYDVRKIEDALSKKQLVLDLFRDRDEPQEFVHLKIYNPNEQIALSDILPMLENTGFRVIEENPYEIKIHGMSQHVWIRDFKLHIPAGIHAVFDQIKLRVEETILAVWQGEMENDRFNALSLNAGLNCRQVTMLRAYTKYLKQVLFPYAQTAIEQALGQHPSIVTDIVQLFEARFDPRIKHREKDQQRLTAAVDEQLIRVSSAAEDAILRRYVALIMATLRTNYFQENTSSLSFKFDSAQVPELPKPRPHAEIFVYSVRVEGIHLRGGKVARGGLRWSDRHEDFRTEVLGLVKAQQVKNAVIVPVGSKGGFVVKRPPVEGGREAQQAEGIACYKIYLSGLLDLTDNIVDSVITPPAQLVRHDGDDPYLVVAADKGTATFSDIANSVSAEYRFWLGDAFASGGSAGYDHKAMAITARGGWVSVTRHFSEMGIDIQTQDFTCVGIGDMAGDVFGNGMLLSEHIKLVAAFNHMHIFIDPTPDAKTSFAERQRMFKLPRSSWKDYDTKLISKGGGVYERSAKTISLSKEAQAALGIAKATLTPDELIRAILLAPVDLLWNGGIGTYVKSEDETHEQVGDRANNGVRVNGKELRCKIVGEGGNLGFTQKGRIEYARNGGRINTDAIDNSAGVDCSDHEVNIKIALSSEVAAGRLTKAKRDQFLESMTEEVARLVLKDNILQTQAISITQAQATDLLDAQIRLMHGLEQEGLLDRVIEFLPNDRQLAELKAAGNGLTRPEIAVLLAYSKMSLYKELAASDLVDDPYFMHDLRRYFPQAMQKKFDAAIMSHPLKREIIATVVTNSLVNRAGITFASDLKADLRASARDVAAAYTIARDAFGLRDIWNAIEKSEPGLSPALQAQLYARATHFLDHKARWLLRNVEKPLAVSSLVAELSEAQAELRAVLPKQALAQEVALLTSKGAPKPLAQLVAPLSQLYGAADIIALARSHKKPLADVQQAYEAVSSQLGLDWLFSSLAAIVPASRWDRLALQGLAADLYDEQRRLLDQAITMKGGVTAWLASSAEATQRMQQAIGELKASGAVDLAKMMLALGYIRDL